MRIAASADPTAGIRAEIEAIAAEGGDEATAAALFSIPGQGAWQREG